MWLGLIDNFSFFPLFSKLSLIKKCYFLQDWALHAGSAVHLRLPFFQASFSRVCKDIKGVVVSRQAGGTWCLRTDIWILLLSLISYVTLTKLCLKLVFLTIKGKQYLKPLNASIKCLHFLFGTCPCEAGTGSLPCRAGDQGSERERGRTQPTSTMVWRQTQRTGCLLPTKPHSQSHREERLCMCTTHEKIPRGAWSAGGPHQCCWTQNRRFLDGSLHLKWKLPLKWWEWCSSSSILMVLFFPSWALVM